MKINSLLLVLTLPILVLVSGCGKHEAAGGAVGTGAGAIIGASVAGDKDKGTGALIGGLIGNVLGTAMGRSADDQEREEDNEYRERMHARNRARAQHEIARVKEENRRLSQKWCAQCTRQVDIAGAHSCPACGGDLITERYCRQCVTVYSPQSGYRYCPYCRDGVLLASR